MNVFATLGVIFLVSFMVESTVEFALGVPFQKIETLRPYSWLLMYVALAAGVGAAFYYQFDLVSLLGIHLGNGDIPPGPFGIVLTGLTIGRGSNAVHDLIVSFFVKKLDITPAPAERQ